MQICVLGAASSAHVVCKVSWSHIVGQFGSLFRVYSHSSFKLPKYCLTHFLVIVQPVGMWVSRLAYPSYP